MKALLDLFKQVTQEEQFDAITIGLASPDQDPVVVVWRGQEARDDQLPGRSSPSATASSARRSLGPDQGLRVPVRQVQAPEAPRRHLREVRRRSDAVESPPRAYGAQSSSLPRSRTSGSLKSLPSRLGMVLDMTLRDIERVLYFRSLRRLRSRHDAADARPTARTEDDCLAKTEEYGDDFYAAMGAEGIRELLRSIDLNSEVDRLRAEHETTTSETKSKKFSKRLKILEGFQKSGIKPEWMVLEVLPVLPPDLRPLVPLDGGRFATSDLNDLYRRVINRNKPPEAPARAQGAGNHRAQRKAHAAGGCRLAARQRSPRQGDDRCEQAPAEVPCRHDQGQGRPLPPEPPRQARRTTRAVRSSSSARS